MTDPSDKTTLQHQTGHHGPAVGGERVSLVLFHRDGAKVVPLRKGQAVVVGRTWPADAVVDDPSLSRQHASFEWREDGFFVEDLDSTNGTILHGEPIKAARITQGQSVVLGAVTASVHVAEPRGGTLEGLDGHDRFTERLHEEVVRGRSFGRPLALLMVRDVSEDAHVSRWCARIAGELREVDRMCLYGPRALYVLLPEADATRAEAAARTAIRSQLGEPSLRCGIALFPDAGAHAEELIEAARTACRQTTGSERMRWARGNVHPSTPVVVSPKMVSLHAMIDRVAASPIHVVVRGETGTGKELVATALHERGPRASGPLRSINCGAIPDTLLESVLFGHEKGAFTGALQSQPGVFEQAHQGTVFLDEVGELAPAAQAALLRVLETKRVARVGATAEREVDVRVVAATHRDLRAMVEAGTFRQDLLYRLDGITLEIPALRERPEEIAPLAERFLAAARQASGATATRIHPDALRRLMDYGWPGNVRELRNVIERAVVLATTDEIRVDDLPSALRGGITRPPPASGEQLRFKDRIRQYETELIVDALRRSGGNQTEAAKLLGMPLRTLVHKIKQFGIQKQFVSE